MALRSSLSLATSSSCRARSAASEGPFEPEAVAGAAVSNANDFAWRASISVLSASSRSFNE
eukprot:14710622-Alexandrium_andersonii.AAC.1